MLIMIIFKKIENSYSKTVGGDRSIVVLSSQFAPSIRNLHKFKALLFIYEKVLKDFLNATGNYL